MELFERVKACRECAGVQAGSAVLGAGNGPVPANIMFVGEAPGRFGAGRTGVPFHGDASGLRFEALLAEAGLRRNDVFITNAVLCLPLDASGRNRRPLGGEMARCRAHLAATIALVRPLLVVALGRVALDSLGGIEAHGLSLRADAGRAVAWQGRTLAALYHPGRQAELHRAWTDQLGDWRRVGECARELIESRGAAYRED